MLTPVEEDEVLRCIKVGLLCTQSRRHSRPAMTSVIRLLEGELSSEPLEMEWLLRQEHDDTS